jgi:hypothetical protein
VPFRPRLLELKHGINWLLTVNNNTFCFATIDKVFIKYLLYSRHVSVLIRPHDDSLIRSETCEYRRYLIKNLSIVAKQKVLLFTVNITRNRMQNPIIMTINSHYTLVSYSRR